MTVQDISSILPYAISSDELLNKLETNKAKGLSTVESAKRLLHFGENAISEKKKISPYVIFLRQFKNSLTITLFVAVILILFVYFFGKHEESDLIEAGLIMLIIVLIAVLGFVQEFKAEKALASLKKLLAFKAYVLRDGHRQEILVSQLVPGDILFLEEGAKVPADIRLIEVINLYTNEAALTGESLPVSKKDTVLSERDQISDQKNMAFAGTAVTSGRAIGVVVHTGNHTEIGKIAKLVASETDESTPIQQRLDKIGKNIGYLVLVVCMLVFLFVVFLDESVIHLSLTERIVTSFIAAVALAVAAIPEGLPAVVTISLALGTQRLAKKKALVRKLNAVEVLGSVDVICTDKTGTLTKNEMTVREIYFDFNHVAVSGTGYDTKGSFSLDGEVFDPKELRLLLQAGLSCNNSSVLENKIIGDPTEAALMVSALKAGLTDQFERIFEIPFTSERKRMSVVVKNGNDYLLFMKGAPEYVLEHCPASLHAEKQTKLSLEEKTSIHEKVSEMNSKALRTLGFAYKKMTMQEYEKLKHNPDLLEHDLLFLGLQGMIDPAREDVAPLIKACHESGIRIIVITGDHEKTARAVAKEIGIPGEALTGEALDAMDEKDLLVTIKNINIYARVNPGTKMKIVQALKQHGHIVAMTGDGVNDAPALKKADIGIAMGITGTDVAKEAADIVLLDDKFSTIVSAIEEGRTIFLNIRKFVHYLLASNVGEVMVVFTGIVIYRDLPLTAIMLLWINVVTDGFPAIALGMDPGSKQIMKVPARQFQQEILTRKIWIEMFIFSIVLTTAVLGIFQFHPGSMAENRGVAFLTITIVEFIYLFVLRKQYHTSFFSNRWLYWAIYYMLVLQVLIVYTPFLATIFEATTPTHFDLLYIVGASIVVIGFYWMSNRNFAPRSTIN